jgi:hypothetical protein
MKEFKFFQKEVKGTLDVLDGETRATASFNSDTPEGFMGRRMLYHTNRDLYDGLTRQRIEDQERQDRIMRRLNSVISQEEILRRRHELFQTTTVTKVNPKWWMKIKMFFQKMKLYVQTNQDIFGIIFLAASVTICFGLMISKILNVW